MDIIVTWNDRRLQYESESPNERIVLQSSENVSIWRPDIVIDAEKGVKYETFPGTLAIELFINLKIIFVIIFVIF